MPSTRLWPPHQGRIKRQECEGCPRYKSGVGFVPGVGPLNARLILIGEQPGRDEIRTGIPFYGASGRIVRSALGGEDAAEGVFITNVRKCMGGTDAEPKEIRRASIAHCEKAYLAREWAVLAEGRCIVAVGADAERAVVGLDNISFSHGSVWSRKEADAVRAARRFMGTSARRSRGLRLVPGGSS
jgi:DNA polymerase